MKLKLSMHCSQTFLSLLVILATLTACSKVITKFDEVMPDRQKEYQKSKTLPALEVPPDLSAKGINDSMAIPKLSSERGTAASSLGYTASAPQQVSMPPSSAFTEPTEPPLAAERKNRKSSLENAVPSKNGITSEEVLIVNAKPEAVWTRLHEYWGQGGKGLAYEDQAKGLIEMNWLEDQQNLTRERYTAALAPAEQGAKTRVRLRYIFQTMRPNGELMNWQTLAEPPVGQAENLAQLKSRLGELSVVDKTAAPAAAAIQQSRTAEGKPYLTVPAGFAEVWKETGAALSKTGYKVEENKVTSVYVVDYPVTETKTKPGLFSSLAFWRGKDQQRYQVSLTDLKGKTELVVLDNEGNWANDANSQDLLKQLRAALEQKSQSAAN